MNEPCRTCPWRKSSTVGGSDIPGFNIELMRGLSNTVGQGDALRPIMACHYSPCGEESACVGYVAVEGYRNISVRLLAAKGEIDLPGIDAACEGLELWQSFDEMLEAYELAREESYSELGQTVNL
jgi:hypothetical protein